MEDISEHYSQVQSHHKFFNNFWSRCQDVLNIFIQILANESCRVHVQSPQGQDVLCQVF